MVLGATGLVGGECVRLLLDDETVERVVVLTRRPLTGFDSPKLERHVVDFATLSENAPLFSVDQIFCAMGTTRRKTPSRDEYRKIDFTYPLTAAQLGVERGVSHYLLVSAVGADSQSRIFYNRLKGELEDALKSLAFRSLTIAQPSVLIGERLEPRLSEKIAWKLGFLTPAKYRPVYGSSVARALVNLARADKPGLHIIANRDIERLASA